MNQNHNNEATAMTNTDNNPATAWQLIGLSPALADLTIDIDKSLSIGRSDSNDLVLATSQISRQHAKINRIGEQLYVQDLGSSNGTFVNGERITTETHALQATDELAFADLLFLVVNDAFDADSLLNTLEQIETVTPTVNASPQVEQQPASTTVPVKDPVIDIVTTQDFVPTNQPTTAATQQTVAINQVQSVDATPVNDDVKTVAPTQQAPTPTITMPVADGVAANEPLTSQQPSKPPVPEAISSPVSTVNAAPIKPVAKKNASLAIIIVVIIALIILATVFMQ